MCVASLALLCESALQSPSTHNASVAEPSLRSRTRPDHALSVGTHTRDELNGCSQCAIGGIVLPPWRIGRIGLAISSENIKGGLLGFHCRCAARAEGTLSSSRPLDVAGAVQLSSNSVLSGRGSTEQRDNHAGWLQRVPSMARNIPRTSTRTDTRSRAR